MSILEAPDYANRIYDERQSLLQLVEDSRLNDFQGMLQEAFSFIKSEVEDDEAIFQAMREIFKEYYDKDDLVRCRGYKFEELKPSSTKDEVLKIIEADNIFGVASRSRKESLIMSDYEEGLR